VASSLIALLAAVAVARFRFRFRFRFRTTYLIMLLIVQMLPQQALVISLYLDFRSLGLLDSLVGLILVYTTFALPVTIWMLRNFVAAVRRELEVAAALDGAGPMRIFPGRPLRSGCCGHCSAAWPASPSSAPTSRARSR